MISKVLRMGLLAVGLVLLVTGVAALVLHFYRSSGNLTIYPTSAVPLAVLTTAAAVLVFASLRSWILAGLSVLVVGGLLVTQLPLWRAAPVSASAPTFTVITSNLMMGEGDIGELSRIVERERPEIVSLQELTPQAWARIQASPIVTMLPNAFAVPGPAASGTALLTRGPLREQRVLPGMVLNNLAAVTDVPGVPSTTVFAVHPGAPVPGAGYGELAVKDMGVLRGHLEGMGRHPMIAAGDFNATWDHKHFRELLTGGVADATDQAGGGWLPTYPTDRFTGPVVGIDHVISSHFVATHVKTYTLPGSDHRALVVKLTPAAR